MQGKKYSRKKAALIRFLRTIIPQIPTIVIYLISELEKISPPNWVIPTLVFTGAVATALDKFLRDLKNDKRKH